MHIEGIGYVRRGAHSVIYRVSYGLILCSILLSTAAHSYYGGDDNPHLKGFHESIAASDYIAQIKVIRIEVERVIYRREGFDLGSGFGMAPAVYSIGRADIQIVKSYPELDVERISVRCIVSGDTSRAAPDPAVLLVTLNDSPQGVTLSSIDALVRSAPRYYEKDVVSSWSYVTNEFRRTHAQNSVSESEFVEAVDRFIVSNYGPDSETELATKIKSADEDVVKRVFLDRINKPRGGKLAKFLYPFADEPFAVRYYDLYVEDMLKSSPVVFSHQNAEDVLRIAAKHPGPGRKERLIRMMEVTALHPPLGANLANNPASWSFDPIPALSPCSGQDVREVINLYRPPRPQMPKTHVEWRADNLVSLISPRDRIDKFSIQRNQNLWPSIQCTEFSLVALSADEMVSGRFFQLEQIPLGLLAALEGNMASSNSPRAEAMSIAMAVVSDSYNGQPRLGLEGALLIIGQNGDESHVALILDVLQRTDISVIDRQMALVALTRLGHPHARLLWTENTPEELEMDWDSGWELVSLAYLGDESALRGLRAIADGSYKSDPDLYADTRQAWRIIDPCLYFNTPEMNSLLIEYLYNEEWYRSVGSSRCPDISFDLLLQHADDVLMSLLQHLERDSSKPNPEPLLGQLMGVPIINDTILPGREADFWRPYVEAFIDEWRTSRALDEAALAVN